MSYPPMTTDILKPRPQCRLWSPNGCHWKVCQAPGAPGAGRSQTRGFIMRMMNMWILKD